MRWRLLAAAVGASSAVWGADLLHLPASARAAGLAGAVVASGDDASVLWENPALIADLPRGGAAIFHRPFGDGAAQETMTFSRHFGAAGGMAAGAALLDAGTIDRVDASGVSLGAVSPRDQLWSVGWGRRWLGRHPLRGWSWGVAGKFLDSRLASSTRGAAGDIGLRTPSFGRWRAGAAVQNVGPSLHAGGASTPWPRVWRLGVAGEFSRWRWTAEAVRRASEGGDLSVGLERAFPLSNRASAVFRAGGGTAPREGAFPVAFGLGVAWGSLRIDYFHQGANAVSDVHGVGLSWTFADRGALPPTLAAAVARGARLMEEGRYPESVLAYDEALALDPHCAVAWDGLEEAGRRMRGR